MCFVYGYLDLRDRPPGLPSIALVDEDTLLSRFGTHPTGPALDEIRRLLREARAAGPEADTLAMMVLYVQLFNHGSVEDILEIWRAKESSWDAHASIDIQLICGAGLAATKEHLAASANSEARAALEYLGRCEAAGDFDGFTPAERSAWYDQYYGIAQQDETPG
jgi:hypothetical protein